MAVLIYTLNSKNEACPCILHSEQVTGSGKAKSIGGVQEYVIDQSEVALPFAELTKKYPCTVAKEFT